MGKTEFPEVLTKLGNTFLNNFGELITLCAHLSHFILENSVGKSVIKVSCVVLDTTFSV